MMPEGSHNIEDFLADDSFCSWILSDKQINQERWDNYLNEYPMQVQMVEEAAEMVRHLADLAPDRVAEVDQGWLNLQKNLSNVPEQTKIRRRNTWYYVAASIAVLFLAVFLWWPVQKKHQTGFGELKELTLPDGTLVSLEANSRLCWKGKWADQDTRQVFLEGEAYFEVSPATENDGMAFNVTAEPLQVQVLGTIFNLVNRKNRQQLTLVEGSVVVNAIDQPTVTLKPGEQYNWVSSQQKGQKKSVETQLFTDWRNHIWHFQSTSLREVAQRIEDHFGVHVKFTEDHLKERTISGALPATQLSQIIEILQTTLNISISKDQTQLIISAGLPQ
jgi:ferric-dicitrate binding protein FerR (iron transport regulator)